MWKIESLKDVSIISIILLIRSRLMIIVIGDAKRICIDVQAIGLLLILVVVVVVGSRCGSNELQIRIEAFVSVQIWVHSVINESQIK